MSSIYHDESSSIRNMISDISDKHCPDSIRDSAYREMEERGYSRRESQRMADDMYGDYW